MKKKVISCILLFCMLVTLFVLLFCVDKKTVQYQSYNQENYISVMVYDETEDDYVKQNSIPTGDYELNEELSYCEGKGSIEDYDSELGVVTTKIKGSDKCYYYFDIGMYAYITRDFSFNDYEQTLTLPKTGDVTIEVWGAQGGNYDSTYQGGYGAYAVGTINLTAGTTLYLNTGGQGQRCSSGQCAGGYNGGGTAITGSQTGSSGGGATSVALASGTLAALAAQNKQNQVIIIAAGGGGTGYGQSNSSYPGYGGNGGGIQGNNGTSSYSTYNGTYGGTGATQSGGGTQQSSSYCGSSGLTYTGSYGQGGASADSTCGGSGGGGGYYGGGGALRGHNGAGGGSSYIGYSTLTNKKMVCNSCTESAASNTNTYTVSNNCALGEATSDCSKIGNGHIRITHYVLTDGINYEVNSLQREETWTVPRTGTYQIEVWGAQGGNYDTTYQGGYGAYATGEITLTKNTTLYINVGAQGVKCTSGQCAGGYNGGGTAITGSQTGSSGGGATSVAFASGTLSELAAQNKQNEVIIIAAGGGGTGNSGTAYGYGGNGGGIQGNDGTCPSNSSWNGNYGGTGATQSGGGTKQSGDLCSSASGLTYTGSFGQGGASADLTCGGNGGGGGYYGGGGALRGHNGAGGGSSYIAYGSLSNKHMTCNSCTTSASSNTNTYTISNSCSSSEPTVDCAKIGDGYVRITYLNKNYNYESTTTNSEYVYNVSKTGNYKLEVWGAQGGNYDNTYQGGYGAYATGVVTLTKGNSLYINVGAQGQKCTSGQCAGGYNGGGTGLTGNQTCSSGGGATSIALSSGTLASLAAQNKQSDVIIVAGGGGGAGLYSSGSTYVYGINGHAGGIQGNNGASTQNNYIGTYGATGATQSAGGTKQNGSLCGSASGLTYTGSFGQGGAAGDLTCGGNGGGGGYYGGGGSIRGHNAGGGGSSYIGYNSLTDKEMVCYSCTTSAASNTNTYTMSNTCANATATSECSKIGDGYVRITYLGEQSPLVSKPLSSNNASDGGIASAYIANNTSNTSTSSTTGVRYTTAAYAVFDNNMMTVIDDSYGSAGSISNSQITYQFPRKAVVNKISIANDDVSDSGVYAISTAKVQRSDDGTNWIDVATLSNMNRGTYSIEYSYNFENQTSANYWRLKGLTSSSGYKWLIQELQFYGYFEN